MNELKSILNLYQFKGYDVSSITRHVLTVFKLGKTHQSIFKVIGETLYICLINRTKYVLKKNYSEKVILCFTFISNKRKDFQTLFENVINTIDKKNILCEKKTFIFDYYVLHNFLCLFIWLLQLRTYSIPLKDKLIIIRKLLEILRLKRFLAKNAKKISNVSALLVFNDSLPSGNYLVQFFKKKGIKTATLQHGIILAPRNGVSNVDFVGLELLNSNSDYFLAWNNFTREEALEAGLSDEKVKVLGITKCINLENRIINNTESNVFGVVLDGEFTAENNPILISIAKELAEKLDMRFILRIHPRMDINRYNSLLNDTRYFAGYSDKKDNIFTYMTQVNFSIIANSTVYIEMIYVYHKVFRYSNGSIIDKYKKIEWGRFSNSDELYAKIKFSETDEQQHLFNELVTVSDIKKSYSVFFEDF